MGTRIVARVAAGRGRGAALCIIAALLLGGIRPAGGASAAGGAVLFHVDGATGEYTDAAGTRPLSGGVARSDRGRAFGPRLLVDVAGKRDASLAGFPYGAFGLSGTDANGDLDYVDPGEVDPVRLMDDMRLDGAYNLAVSPTLGRLPNEAEIARVLEGARDRRIGVILRATELVYTSPTGAVTRPTARSLNTPDEQLNVPDSLATRTDLVANAGGVYTMDAAATGANLQRLRRILDARPDLAPVVRALYSYDEPMQRNMSLAEMRRIYQAHKDAFPGVPVFTVFNQSRTLPDNDGDGISDGMLGQPQNPYGAGVTDIAALNIYPMGPNYDYAQVGDKFGHARRVVDRVAPRTPVWAVPQGHGLVTSPADTPEPHQLYRQLNDWLRAAADAGLRGADGLLWYSWHFPPGSAQNLSDLEDNPANRRVARLIGERLHGGAVATHALPYRPELHAPTGALSAVRAPAAGHLDPSGGTLHLSFTHAWAGDDGARHVLFDTGEGEARNRLLLEKTAGGVLRLAVVDAGGGEKWAGIGVGPGNFPGTPWSPGYSDIAVTWGGGELALYLDGARGALGGGSGSGVLSSAGPELFIGTDLAGLDGADGTYGHLTIRGGALTEAEAVSWANGSHLSGAPGGVSLSSPADNAALAAGSRPTLAWAAVPDAARYRVQVSAYPDFTRPVTDTSVSGTEYTAPAPLTEGRTYHWRVGALDAYGAGAWSAPGRFTVPDTVAPAAKAPLQGIATPSQLGTGSVPVRVSWPSATDAGSGIAAYHLQQSADGGATYADVALPSAAATSVVRPLAPGAASYRFRVRARDGAGNWGAWATGASFKLRAYQESDPALRYTAGAWGTAALGGAYGGSVRYSGARGATARLTFTGASFAWAAPKGPGRGKAEVYQVNADGTRTRLAAIDLYSPSTLARQLVFVRSWAVSGARTLEIRVTGARAPAPTAARVDVDALPGRTR